jgi:hypothetical protein
MIQSVRRRASNDVFAHTCNGSNQVGWLTVTGGFLYFWQRHEAWVSGSTKRRVRCVECSYDYEYEITREGWGRGDSPYSLSNTAAAANAKMRARADLARSLNEAIEPRHCPVCGIFQPDMVRLFRKQYGKQFDPNKYASKRIIGSPGAFAGSPFEALRAADAENTVEAYTKLMETWPYTLFLYHAKQRIEQIEQLKYPPFVRWLRSHVWWIVWAVFFLLVIGIIGVGEGRYYNQ